MRRRRAERLLKLAAILGILVVFGAGIAKVARRAATQSAELRALQARLEALEKENKTLREDIKRMQTPEELERMARKLGFVKKGEVAFRVVPDTEKQEQESPKEEVDGRGGRRIRTYPTGEEPP